MELNTGYVSAALAGSNPPPGWVCPAPVVTTVGAWKLTWTVGYNEYANRLGISMPKTNALITNTILPSSYRTSNFMDYETLTNYGTP